MCLSTDIQDLHSKLTLGGKLDGSKLLDKQTRQMNTGIEKELGFGPPEAPQAPKPLVIGGPDSSFRTSSFAQSRNSATGRG